MSDSRIARVVLGLALALALAVLLAHPRVRALQRRFGIGILLGAGIPFLGIGAIFSLESVGILTEAIKSDLRPAFNFGLGWIGFAVGMHFDIRRLERFPSSLGTVIALESLAPMITTAAYCGLVLAAIGVPLDSSALLLDVLVLMACAAASAPVNLEKLRRAHGHAAARIIDAVTELDDIAALGLLGVIAIFFRPSDSATRWVLPSSAWLLVCLGLGTVLGALSYVLIRGAKSQAEELALLLGSIALAAGMSDYLSLPAPVICAIAGALLTNLPTHDKTSLRRTLYEVERPLYLIFLMVVGASWRPDEWQGWVLAPAFVLARVLGKRAGSRLAKRFGPPELPPEAVLARALTPQSPIAVVVIVSAATLFGRENQEVSRWAINAVIIGGVLTDAVLRLLERGEATPHSSKEMVALEHSGLMPAIPERAPTEPNTSGSIPPLPMVASEPAPPKGDR